MGWDGIGLDFGESVREKNMVDAMSGFGCWILGVLGLSRYERREEPIGNHHGWKLGIDVQIALD